MMESMGTPRRQDVATRARQSVADCFEKISLSLRPYTPLGGLSGQDPLTTELRECITAYVGSVRESGMQPEAVLVALKALVRDHLHADDFSRVAISEDVMQWAIAAYYPA